MKGDMMVLGQPSARLAVALDVIAENLHPVMYAHGLVSKNACILSSLTVRDFLRKNAFVARTKTCCALVRAWQAGKELHSLGLGAHDAVGPGWSGHLVVLVDDYLIDTTLYQARRKQWPMLPGMIALPVARRRNIISGCSLTDDDYRVELSWVRNPKAEHGWVNAPDASPSRREPVVEALDAIYHGRVISM